MGHLNFKDLSKAIKNEFIVGLPKLGKIEKTVCCPCQMGKQLKAQHRKTKSIHTYRPLELLHTDLMSPSTTESMGGKIYIMVIVDDFSKFTWVVLLREKSEVFEQAKALFKKIQVEKGNCIKRIRSDRGKEFENAKFSEFCDENGIVQEFSATITPQQKGIVKRKNRVIQEMA